ncbi:MAG: M48 family metalloprotease [Candidatus Zipacnadales bacterium]
MLRAKNAAFLCVLLLTGALYASAHAGLLGIEEERRIGRQVADNLEKEYRLVPEGAKTKRVQEIGARVAVFAIQDRPKIEYTFNVLADKQINALAAPGGYIYVFRGILRVMDEEELLAAVLAHEAAHVSKRHGMQTLERALGFSLLLGAVTGGSSDLGNVALNLLMRGYSRQQEAEADKVGHIYLFKAGYDVGAMVRMLERLHSSTEEDGSMPNFLRTHPSGETRIAAARRREAEILLELGSEHPAVNPPHLVIIFQPEAPDQRECELGEKLGEQLSQLLNASAQFRTDFAGVHITPAGDRLQKLGSLAAEQGVEGAIGLSFTAPALTSEATERQGKTIVKLAVEVRVVGTGASQAEMTETIETGAERRDADEVKLIERALEAKIAEAARLLAIAILRPGAQEIGIEE